MQNTQSRTGGASMRGFEVALGTLAALPTLAGALFGAGLALDDWSFAAVSRYATFSTGFGADTRARPLSGLWRWTQFRLFGTHPAAHLVLLAALNAAAAVLLWRLLDRWLPRPVAVLTALVWVALPNRGSTQLWVTTATLVSSLVLLLAGLLVASTRPLTGRRFGVALTLLALSTLLYEGGIAIGIPALVSIVWTTAPRNLRLRWVALAVCVIGAAATWVLLHSPKVGTSPPPFRYLTHLAGAHFGSAVLSGPSVVLALILLISIAWCLAVVVLPGFEATIEQKTVVVGLAVVLLGAAPFAAAGFPFSGSGFFDRGNLFSDLGTSLVYGSLLALLLRLPWRRVGTALAVFGVLLLALPNVGSVQRYVRAGRDGRRFLEATDALPLDVRTKGPVTFEPLPAYGGVSMFLADYDISGALALRYGTGAPFPRAAMAVRATGFKPTGGPTFRLVGNKLVRVEDVPRP